MDNNEVTTDDLAAMIKKGFDEVDVKFEKVNNRFDEVDVKFEKVNGRFDEVNGKFDQVNVRFDKLEGKVVNLPTKEYLDNKIADAIVEIFTRLDKKGIKETDFKSRIVKIIKENSLASKEDVAYLEGLVLS